MIIAAVRLSKYLPLMEFPVPLLKGWTHEVIKTITRQELRRMIELKAVTARGTRNTVRDVHLTHPQNLGRDHLPSAADNKTIFLDGRTWAHHDQRSRTYGAKMRKQFK